MSLGLDVGSECFSTGAVMGIMIIPFISSLSDDIINSIPQSLEMVFRAWGNKAETTKSCLLVTFLV